jgi:hypothetical protein
MVRLAGFEPAAYGLEVRCSIQLSYRRTLKTFRYHMFADMSIEMQARIIFAGFKSMTLADW